MSQEHYGVDEAEGEDELIADEHEKEDVKMEEEGVEDGEHHRQVTAAGNDSTSLTDSFSLATLLSRRCIAVKPASKMPRVETHAVKATW